jgi:hypothetical protein
MFYVAILPRIIAPSPPLTVGNVKFLSLPKLNVNRRKLPAIGTVYNVIHKVKLFFGGARLNAVLVFINKVVIVTVNITPGKDK